LKPIKALGLAFRAKKKASLLQQIVPPILKAVLANLPANKTMRWADKTESFVRPVHWIVLLHGDTILPFEAFGINSNRLSYGHRIHGKNPFSIATATDYEQNLNEQFVIADFDKRKAKIKQQIHAAATQMNGEAILEEDLLDEVCGLTEWPTAYVAHFSERYLAIPKEALISAMQKHQRCFAIQDPTSKKALTLFYFNQ
jgi:glycyl-tRNA synthetase beta chain